MKFGTPPLPFATYSLSAMTLGMGMTMFGDQPRAVASNARIAAARPAMEPFVRRLAREHLAVFSRDSEC